MWLNYTVVELEALVNDSALLLPPGRRSYVLPTVMPGTTYTAVVSFVNEAGEGMNTTSELRAQAKETSFVGETEAEFIL